MANVSENRKRFVDVAGKRITKVIKGIDMLGNCANTSNYEYTEKDVAKILQSLNTACNELKKAFEKGGAKEDKKAANFFD